MAKKTKKTGEGKGPGSAGTVPVVDDATAVTPRKTSRQGRDMRGDGVLGPSDITLSGEETGEKFAVAPRSVSAPQQLGSLSPEPDDYADAPTLENIPPVAGPIPEQSEVFREPQAQPAGSQGAEDVPPLAEVTAVQLASDASQPAGGVTGGIPRRLMGGRRRLQRPSIPDVEPTIIEMDAAPHGGEVDEATSFGDPHGDVRIDVGKQQQDLDVVVRADSGHEGASSSGTEVQEIGDVHPDDLIVEGDEAHTKDLPTIVDVALELQDRWALADDGYYYCYDLKEKEVYRLIGTEAVYTVDHEEGLGVQVVGGIRNGQPAIVTIDALRDPLRIALYHPDKFAVEHDAMYRKAQAVGDLMNTVVLSQQKGRGDIRSAGVLKPTIVQLNGELRGALESTSLNVGKRRFDELPLLIELEVGGIRDIVDLRQLQTAGGQLFEVTSQTAQFLQDFENFFGLVEQVFERYAEGGFEVAQGSIYSQGQADRSVDFNTVLREALDFQKRLPALGIFGGRYHSRYVGKMPAVIELLRVLNDDYPSIPKLDTLLRLHGRILLNIVRILFKSAQEYMKSPVTITQESTPPTVPVSVTATSESAVVPAAAATTIPAGTPVSTEAAAAPVAPTAGMKPGAVDLEDKGTLEYVEPVAEPEPVGAETVNSTGSAGASRDSLLTPEEVASLLAAIESSPPSLELEEEEPRSLYRAIERYDALWYGLSDRKPWYFSEAERAVLQEESTAVVSALNELSNADPESKYRAVVRIAQNIVEWNTAALLHLKAVHDVKQQIVAAPQKYQEVFKHPVVVKALETVDEFADSLRGATIESYSSIFKSFIPRIRIALADLDSLPTGRTDVSVLRAVLEQYLTKGECLSLESISKTPDVVEHIFESICRPEISGQLEYTYNTMLQEIRHALEVHATTHRRHSHAERLRRVTGESTWQRTLKPGVELYNTTDTMRVTVQAMNGDTITLFASLQDGMSGYLTYTLPNALQWLERNGFQPDSIVGA